MTVFNGNRTLEFIIDKEEYAGQQYFFKVVLKEVGVNAIGIPYYCQVFVDNFDGSASTNQTSGSPTNDTSSSTGGQGG